MHTKLDEEEVMYYSPCTTVYLKTILTSQIICLPDRDLRVAEQKWLDDTLFESNWVSNYRGGWAKHCISLHSAYPLRGFQSQFERHCASPVWQPKALPALCWLNQSARWNKCHECHVLAVPVICICHLLLSPASAFVFAESIRWHLISLPVFASGL